MLWRMSGAGFQETIRAGSSRSARLLYEGSLPGPNRKNNDQNKLIIVKSTIFYLKSSNLHNI